MTRSIARACQTDGDIFTSLLSQEQTAATDRQAACRLGGVADPNPIPTLTVASEEMDEELLARLSALHIQVPTEDCDFESATMEAVSEYEPESYSWAATRQTAQPLDHHCIACQKLFRLSDTARVPCNHDYCRDCLQDLFRASITDDSLFPPRCCRQPLQLGQCGFS